MADPVRAWHDEHAYFERLLGVLRQEVDQFTTGETPNYPLMLDIITYLHDWSDAVHHRREDEVFRRLVLRCPEHRLAIARLQQEHKVIGQAGEVLRKLLEEVQADAVVSRAEVEVAAATYLVYYGNHIAAEEEEILPLAAQVLSAEDWAASRDVVASGPDPLLSARPGQRFHDLRRRIATEAA